MSSGVVWVMHAGWGGVSCRDGVGHVGVGWGRVGWCGSCRGEVGRVGWGGSCRGGVGHAEMEWDHI